MKRLHEPQSNERKIIDYFFLVLGLFISGVGVAITKKGELGVSPVSSVANIMSIYVPSVTLGNWLILWNCVLILGQFAVLGKNFRLFQLLQVPLSFLFGFFTDFGSWLMSHVECSHYAFRLGCVFAGTMVLAFGIAMTVTANVIMNSGEAFVKAITDRFKKEFGTIKIIFDVSCVTISIILSMIFFDGKICGTREGTIIAAIFTGLCVKVFMKLLKLKK